MEIYSEYIIKKYMQNISVLWTNFPLANSGIETAIHSD